MTFNPPLGPVDQVKPLNPKDRIDVTHLGSKEREYIRVGRENGWLTADDVRRRERLLPSVVEPSHHVDWTGAPTRDCGCLQCVERRASEPPRIPIPWPRVWHYAWRIAGILAWAFGWWAIAEMV